MYILPALQKCVCLCLILRSSTLSSAVSSLSSTGISLSRMDDKTEESRLQQHKARHLQEKSTLKFILLVLNAYTTKPQVFLILHTFVEVEKTSALILQRYTVCLWLLAHTGLHRE